MDGKGGRVRKEKRKWRHRVNMVEQVREKVGIRK